MIWGAGPLGLGLVGVDEGVRSSDVADVVGLVDDVESASSLSVDGDDRRDDGVLVEDIVLRSSVGVGDEYMVVRLTGAGAEKISEVGLSQSETPEGVLLQQRQRRAR